MSERQYWLDLFTYKTWQEFLKAGGKVSGFRESRWNTVKKIHKGDYLLCYLTGVSRWIGVLEVTGDAFLDKSTKIWDYDIFPARVPVKKLVELTAATAVPILEMKEALSIFQNLKSPFAWTGAVRSSPALWKGDDGRAVVSALEKARENPVERPFDEGKLSKVPPVFSARNLGAVTIPDAGQEGDAPPPAKESKEPTEHDEIQFLLLKLGSDMGLDIWVAKNDRGKQFKGQVFNELSRMLDDLPVQFEEATTNTIKLIDVLWLKGKTIVAAFEIESTTSIYSGLLRMSDLVAMQPNINIPLYIVAPDERREKVTSEINRPTFSSLSPRMNEACRYLPFDQLRKRVQQAGDLVRYLKPEFLDEVSESCELPAE